MCVCMYVFIRIYACVFYRFSCYSFTFMFVYSCIYSICDTIYII